MSLSSLEQTRLQSRMYGGQIVLRIELNANEEHQAN